MSTVCRGWCSAGRAGQRVGGGVHTGDSTAEVKRCSRRHATRATPSSRSPEGPRYKAHYKLTPPGGVGSQWTYLTAEYTTEVAALEAALAAAKKVVDKGLPPLGK